MTSDSPRLDFLTSTFSTVNEWLRFAEAKNAALITLNAGLTAGIIGFSLTTDLGYWFKLYAAFSAVLLIASVILSLISFIPRLKPPFWFKQESASSQDNLLFFGHICKYSPRNYLDRVLAIVSGESESELMMHMANQIVVNAKIAMIKFKYFEVAVWITLSAALTPLGTYLLSKVRS